MRMRSNGLPSHHASGAVASPVTSLAVSPSRVEVLAHAPDASGIAIDGPDLALPAARARGCDRSCRRAPRTRRARAARARRSSSSAARCAARSCTDTSPAAKPGSDSTPTGCSRRTADSTSGAATAASPAASSLLEIIRARRAQQIHAQPHRRRGVVGVENRLPLARLVGAECVDEPARMREPRFRLGRAPLARAARARVESGAARR